MNWDFRLSGRAKFGLTLLLPAALFAVRDFTFLKTLPSGSSSFSFPVFADHWLAAPFFLFFLSLAGYSIGATLLGWIDVELDIDEEVVFAIPLGLAIVSFIVLGLGLLSVLHAPVFWGALSALILLGWRRGLHWILRWSELLADFSGWLASLNLIEIFCLNLLAWVTWHGWIVALSPPVEGDSIAYHLANAAEYIRAGKIYWQEGNLWSCFPGNLEMLYLLGLILKGEVLAQLIPWMLNLLLFGALVRFGKRFFGSRTLGFLAAAIFSVQPVFTAFLGSAMQDAGATLFIVLSLYALAAWKESDRRSWLALAGSFAGVAAGTKYSALPFAFLIGVFVIAIQLVNKRFRLKEVALFSGVLLLFSFPWYLRNAVWTGNPVWPLGYEIFGGKFLTAPRVELMAALEALPGQERSLSGLLKLPYRMITEPRFGHYYNPEYLTWPLLLVLALLLFLQPPVPWTVFLLGAFALIGVAPVFSTASFWRYYMPALPGLCVIFAWAVEALSRRNSKVVWGILLLMTVAAARLSQRRELFPAFGFATPGAPSKDVRAGYLQTYLAHEPLYEFAHANLPSDAKVLLYEQSDRYHLRRASLHADPLFQSLIHYEDFSSPEQLRDRLHQLGVTHIVKNKNWHTIPSSVDRARLPDWYWRGIGLIEQTIEKYSSPVTEMNGVALYALKANPS